MADKHNKQEVERSLFFPQCPLLLSDCFFSDNIFNFSISYKPKYSKCEMRCISTLYLIRSPFLFSLCIVSRHAIGVNLLPIHLLRLSCTLENWKKTAWFKESSRFNTVSHLFNLWKSSVVGSLLVWLVAPYRFLTTRHLCLGQRIYHMPRIKYVKAEWYVKNKKFPVMKFWQCCSIKYNDGRNDCKGWWRKSFE